MCTPEPECTRRYQPRLNLDERIGGVFESLMALPEDGRKAEIVFLIQLGYLIKKALGQAHATAVAAALLAAVGAASGHLFARGEGARGKHSARGRITRRYQPRLNLDVRLGEIFQELMALPEEARQTEIRFLMQLGYWAKKALCNGLPAAIASIPFASGGVTSESPAVRAPDSCGAELKRGGVTAEESAGAALAFLQGWCVDDDAFELSESSGA